MRFCTNMLKQAYLFFFLFLLLIISGWGNSIYSQNCKQADFRSIDGACNNERQTNWGQAGNTFAREMPALYATSNPYGEMINNRPNPRSISNSIFNQSASIPNREKLSSFVYTWGQFIDHDLDFTPTNPEERANIPLPSNEEHFSNDIAFTRSAVRTGTGIFNNREHTNTITSWIDASQVYGSDEERASWLRTHKRGKLKVSTGNLLPYNTTDGELNSSIDPNAPEMDDPFHSGRPHFVAGDVRANEQPGLTTLHTLFVREHNRVCEELRRNGIRGDERLYQMARKRVGAVIQHITYTEFLPALGVRLSRYRGYNPTVKPDIMHVFATAAYRIGHTMVAEELLMLEDDCSEVRSPVQLGEAFFNIKWIQEFGIDPIMKGLSTQQQEEIDAKIVNGLRNSLFNIPRLPSAVGLDLAAINIQRGRDHGLQDYNTIRAHFTGRRISRFSQINREENVWQALATVYKNDINKIDPWVGMLAEEHIPGRSVGRTMHNILKDQFERLRDGDFYYYEYDPYLPRRELRTIQRTKLSTIIKNNTSLNDIPINVFKVKKCQSSPPIVNDNDLPNEITTCNGVNISYGNGSIHISNPSGEFPYVHIYNAPFRVVDYCRLNCGNKFEVNNLPNGLYTIMTYQTNGSQFCMRKVRLSGKNNSRITPSYLFNKNQSISITSTLYPNPANQQVFISLGDFIGHKASIQLINHYGQVISSIPIIEITDSVIPISVDNLEQGMYQVQIISDIGFIETHKLIVQR